MVAKRLSFIPTRRVSEGFGETQKRNPSLTRRVGTGTNLPLQNALARVLRTVGENCG